MSERVQNMDDAIVRAMAGERILMAFAPDQITKLAHKDSFGPEASVCGYGKHVTYPNGGIIQFCFPGYSEEVEDMEFDACNELATTDPFLVALIRPKRRPA